MFGQGKDLQAAGEAFARMLPIGPELAAAAEAVLAAIEDEISQITAQVDGLRAEPASIDTELPIAFRTGAINALTADRSRWRKIVNVLREVPERPIDPTGYAYFEGQRDT
ncbi:MAG: hypothetical protein H5T78_22960 [Nocardia sp.]|nr:hypothetical protein [Nocardia sp.]